MHASDLLALEPRGRASHLAEPDRSLLIWLRSLAEIWVLGAMLLVSELASLLHVPIYTYQKAESAALL